MGSFRIVTGSGYGRHEVTDARELKRQFDLLAKAATKASANPPRVRSRTRTSRPRATITSVPDKIWNDLTRKAQKWARETAAEMRAKVPVDTGNLRDSIHILKDECEFDKTNGTIRMVVGADLDPAGGQGKLYAPPHRKKSPKYGRKNPPWKGYRLMPEFPNDYSYKYIGDGDGDSSVEKIFRNISRKNAKKIMGK